MRHNPYLLRVLVVLFAVALGSTRAAAQVLTPSFAPPRGGTGLGVFLVDAGDLGLEVRSWRASPAGYEIAFRGGVLDLGGAALTLGAQLRNPIQLDTEPLELAFTVGAQGVLGDVDAVGLDAGVSLGATFVGGNLAVTPYLHPRLGLVKDYGENDGFGLEVLADLGVNLVFATGLTFQVGIPVSSVGRTDWGVGITLR